MVRRRTPPTCMPCTLIPAGNDIAARKREVKGLVALAAWVELATVGEPAGIVHARYLPSSGDWTLTGGEVLDS